MILVDTSVWIDYLRHTDGQLSQLLMQAQVLMHPMIMGELACGHLRQRQQLMTLWQHLPQVTQASDEEALFFLQQHKLMGKGIGWIDLHLLVACQLTPRTQLWTRDKRLNQLSKALGIQYTTHH